MSLLSRPSITDDSGNLTSGTILNAAFFSDIFDRIDTAIGGSVVQTYTPTWEAGGGNPAIGNGSITGAYWQAGKITHFRIWITMGSTTTFGSGAWVFGLPSAGNEGALFTPQAVVGAVDTSASTVYSTGMVGVVMRSTAQKFIIYVGGAAGSTLTWDATHPFTWANGDSFYASGDYFST